MLTLSKTPGIGGAIKGMPEDFLVEEILQNGTVLELNRQFNAEELGQEVSKDGKFTAFILQKRDWNTSQALKEIARRQRRGIRSMGFAGTKDRTSISTQLCSAYGIRPEELLKVRIKDISINGAWCSDSGVKMGELSGNRFTIAIKGSGNHENIGKIHEELNGIFPNYFGAQRFGIRNNNVEIGVDIMKGDFEGAAMKFLTDTANETNQDATDARRKLAEDRDYRSATEYFPKYLKYERLVIESLAREPTDYAKALRKLPRNLALMFVHSVESHIFNKEVECCIERGDVQQEMNGNIVGYDNEINEIEKGLLDGLGLVQEQFRVKSMPELNCRGAKRLLFAPYSDLSSTIDNDMVKLRFSLQAGSYATVLLDEFIKPDQTSK